jgi:hypothetical protein
MPKLCTLLQYTRPYHTVPYRTPLYCTPLYRTPLYSTPLYRTPLYHTVPYPTVPYRTTPYQTAPYCKAHPPCNQVWLDPSDQPWLPQAHPAIKPCRYQLLVPLDSRGRCQVRHAVGVGLRSKHSVGTGVHIPQQDLPVVVTYGASK